MLYYQSIKLQNFSSSLCTKLTEHIYIYTPCKILSCLRRDNNTGGWHRARKKSTAIGNKTAHGYQERIHATMSDGAACKSKVLCIQAAWRGKRYIACCVVTFRRACPVVALLIGGRRNSSDISTVRWLGTDLGAILSDHDYLYVTRYPPVSVEDIKRILFPSSFRSNLDKWGSLALHS